MKTSKHSPQNKLLARAQDTNVSWSTVLNVLILLLAFFVLLPQMEQFSTSLEALKTANRQLVVVAFGLGMSTLLFAALTYTLLAGRIPYLRTLRVQIAGTFTNRLLPAGIGGMGLNIRYLMKQRFPAGQAGSIAATNNFLGFLGHAFLVLLVFIFGELTLGEVFDLNISPQALLLAGAVFILMLGLLWRMKGWRLKVRKNLAQAIHQLLNYRKRPLAMLGSFLSSLSVTLLYVTCFYVCVQAVGLQLDLAQAFVVFTLGIAAGSVTPTPGGLVGVEAGMLAGMIGYGLPEAASLSAVLLYRLVTYWLPIVPGFVMFKWLQHRKVI